jgi:hypothetical protein
MSGLSNVASMLAHSPYLSAALASAFMLLGLEAWSVRLLCREQGELSVLDALDTTSHVRPGSSDES